MNKEKFIPKLVDLSKFNLNSSSSLPTKKWNLNKILLIGFLIFSIFFLYNCKYGIISSLNFNSVHFFL